MTPAMAEPWPPRYLVAECTTMSAPHSMRPDQVGSGQGVVHDERDAGLVRGAGDAFDVQNVLAGIGDDFGEEQLGVRLHRVAPVVQVVRVLHEGDGNAELLQRVGEQVVGAPVQARAGNHVVPGLGDVEDGEGFRGLAGAQQEAAEPPSRLAMRCSTASCVGLPIRV